MRTRIQWHWISSALSLVGMLFFAATGITLNHADIFESSALKVTRLNDALPQSVMVAIDAAAPASPQKVPPALTDWVARTWHIGLSAQSLEWSDEELYIDLKRPGVDASLTIDRRKGEASYEALDRGWVAFFNELHRGRNAGTVWHGFITVFGVACLIFAITGLFLLQMHARSRWITWPLTGLGLVVPLLLILLFIH